jgi:mRNA interferase MazF
VVITQGEVWWADLRDPTGSEPGYNRPLVVVQGESYNLSRVRTVVIVPLTSQLRRGDVPGNVRLPAEMTGLPRESVANVSQISAVDRRRLVERVGAIPEAKLDLIFAGIDVVLGRAVR